MTLGGVAGQAHYPAAAHDYYTASSSAGYRPSAAHTTDYLDLRTGAAASGLAGLASAGRSQSHLGHYPLPPHHNPAEYLDLRQQPRSSLYPTAADVNLFDLKRAEYLRRQRVAAAAGSYFDPHHPQFPLPRKQKRCVTVLLSGVSLFTCGLKNRKY